MKKLVFVAVAFFAIACSSTRHTNPSSGTQQTTPGSVQDGSSYENAIVIKEKRETVGVAAEYKWLREHYPGYKTKMQSLLNKNGKPYDLLTIITADGAEKNIYFDISHFFGKY